MRSFESRAASPEQRPEEGATQGSGWKRPAWRRPGPDAACLGIFLLWTAVSAWATTVVPLSVEELARSAAAVVEARALSSRAAWNPQHTLIYTYTTFQVTRSLKGATAQTVTVKQLGGSAEGYTQKVAGLHHAQAGEHALLFLRPSAAGDGTFVIVGLMQGNFRMFRGTDGRTMVTNGITGAKATPGGQVSEFTGSPMSLRELEARIRRARP